MERKRIVFIDDCEVFNEILINGYFKSHDLAKKNNVVAFSNVVDFFSYIDKPDNNIDAFVIDYHLSSVDGLEVAEIVHHIYPKSKIWMYSGMTEDYIHDTRKAYAERYIHKDKGIGYLFDELLSA